MKRLMSLLLMLIMLFSTAYAQDMQSVLQEIVMIRDDSVDCVYTISPAQCDIDALTAFAFGDQAKESVLENREYGFQHYHLPDIDGVPFCGAGPDHYLYYGMQARISIYRSTGDDHQFNMSENVYPDGKLPEGMITAEEARSISDTIAPALGMLEPCYLSTTAYGRLTKAVQGYKLVYLQKLNNRSIYWGASADTDNQPTTNLLEVVIAGADGELIRAEGEWSSFAPAGDPQKVITWEAAQEAFLRLGIDPQNMERCYWMTPYADENGKKAYPAYRVKSTYMNAISGELLQLETRPTFSE